MTPHYCAGCGAPLPTEITNGVVVCRFCALAHDPSTWRAASAQPAAVQVHVASGSRLMTIVGLLVAAAILGMGALITVLGVSGATLASLFDSSSDKVPAVVATLTKPAALRVADLRRIDSRGIHDLDAEPPASGYGNFDVVAQLPWAVTIAQGWREDARIERIDAVRVRPDGTVNAADDAEASVRYRFASPAERRELMARRETSTRATGVTEFWVIVEKGQARVQFVQGTPTIRLEVPPHPTGAQPLATLIPGLQAREEFRRPFLSGYLIHLEREGWVWYLQPLTRESLPRVRANDGAVWPSYARQVARRSR